MAIMWRPPKKQEDDETDKEDKEDAPPAEPSGFDLTEKRSRQRHSSEWAKVTWDRIAHGLHEEQRKQKYVDEPKGKRRKDANGN